jgi:general secretion pathway protein H
VLRIFLLNKNGFTLIELIIVLIIITIGATLVGIYIGGGREGLQIRSFAKDIAATLRYARNQAVSEKILYCFVIDAKDSMYRLYRVNNEAEGDIQLIIDKPIPEDINVFIGEPGRDVYDIEFFPQGNTSGGEIEVAGKSGRSIRIKVHMISGKVEVTSGDGEE